MQQHAEASLLEESIEAQLEELDLDGLVRYTDLVEPDLQAYVPTLDLQGILTGMGGQLSIRDLFQQLIVLLLQEIVQRGASPSACSGSCSLGNAHPSELSFR